MIERRKGRDSSRPLPRLWREIRLEMGNVARIFLILHDSQVCVGGWINTSGGTA